MQEKWMNMKKKCLEQLMNWKILKELQKNYKEKILILKNKLMDLFKKKTEQ
jgi:hypothetical protein